MTSLPLVLDDDEPIGIIRRAGRKMLRPARIWAYCWFTDEAEEGAGDHTHRRLSEHIDWRASGAGPEPAPRVSARILFADQAVGPPAGSRVHPPPLALTAPGPPAPNTAAPAAP